MFLGSRLNLSVGEPSCPPGTDSAPSQGQTPPHPSGTPILPAVSVQCPVLSPVMPHLSSDLQESWSLVRRLQSSAPLRAAQAGLGLS